MPTDSVNCLDCGTLMTAEEHHGVIIDRCGNCGGLWFDIDEIQTYLKDHPGVPASHEPGENDFRNPLGDEEGQCPCCDQGVLAAGDFREISYRRCSWCGGLFIATAEIGEIVRRGSDALTSPELPSATSAGEAAGESDESWIEKAGETATEWGGWLLEDLLDGLTDRRNSTLTEIAFGLVVSYVADLMGDAIGGW